MDELKKLSLYCEKLSSSPSGILLALERETHLKTLAPQMLTGRLQGQFLSLLSRLKCPQSILEIGTFTGYGAICLAQGLSGNGTLHTIEVNPELSFISEKYIEKAGLKGRIVQHVGDALKLIPTMTNVFDLVYLDAGKQEYSKFYDLILDRLSPGGILVVDNVLWSGKVIAQLNDKDTRAIDSFNQKVLDDERVRNLLLPIRDGLLVVEKI